MISMSEKGQSLAHPASSMLGIAMHIHDQPGKLLAVQNDFNQTKKYRRPLDIGGKGSAFHRQR